MLKSNYFGETKTHYKLYKCGKNWAVMGISLFSLGLGMLVTSRPVSADVTATSTSSSAVKANATSASSSSAVKADATSASSSSAVKADATSASSNATKADAISASSSSAVKADATSASSSSVAKADATSASSSSTANSDATSANSSNAAKADTTSASSSSAAKADATSSSSSSAVKADIISKNDNSVTAKKASAILDSESDTLPAVNLKTNLNGTKSQNDSVSFSYSFDTTNERVIHKGDTVKLNVPSEGLDYSTLQLSDGSNYFSLSYSAEDNVITLTATQDILYEGSVGATIVGNPTKNDSNTNKTGTYNVSSSYSSSLGSTEEIPGDYMTLSVYNGTGFTASFGPHIVGVKDANYATSVGYNNNYSGASNGNAMYVYNQNAMIVAGYLWNYEGTYSNVVWKVRTSGYQIDQQSLRTYLGSKDETNSVTVTWDSDGEGFSIQLPGNYSPWGDQWSLRYVIKTNSNSDVVKGETSVTGIDNSTNSAIVEDLSNHISLNSSTTFEYYPTTNGKFAPYISASDKTIYTTQNLSNNDLLGVAKATDQVDGDISNKIAISSYGGFKVGETNSAGSYTITYSVTNSSGNTSTTTAIVTVLNDQTGIDTKDSTLVAGPNTTWSAGDNFVSATDADGKALSLTDLKVSGSVDPTKAGRYEVTYSYTDAA
ncbi:immunoglobulin-like domain-containing protein, partial [Lactiplantibacillus plantarum]|uniref:immunoglobulin-like domain-containing protein n=1 Tax=Lactiplantibacillus plantarum TaxID=1590 RepID=UPI000977D198